MICIAAWPDDRFPKIALVEIRRVIRAPADRSPRPEQRFAQYRFQALRGSVERDIFSATHNVVESRESSVARSAMQRVGTNDDAQDSTASAAIATTAPR